MSIAFSRHPIVQSHWSKHRAVFQLAFLPLLFALALMLGASALLTDFSIAFAQQKARRLPIVFPTTIRWNKQRGVTKYRLQIANDADFRNVFYDGRIVGEQYVVTGLAPGYYYWRIAPSEGQTGAFLKPVRFFVSGGFVVTGIVPGPTGTRPRLPAASYSKVR
jgi:hypothetical protein